MALQRLLFVGVCLVALAPRAEAGTSAAKASSVIDAEPNSATKSIAAVRLREARSRVRHKAVGEARIGHASSAGDAKPPHEAEGAADQIGYASWYGSERNGRRTASGSAFDKEEL